LVSDLVNIPEKAEEKGISAPAVLIVGDVAGLSNKLSWWEKMPLFGKRVLITRSKSQSAGMAHRISRLAGEPVQFPAIQITDPDDYGPLDDSIGEISHYDWIIFTSVNGVERFFSRFFQLREDIRTMAGPGIGAIGPVTASKLRALNLKVDILAKEFKAEGLLAEFQRDEVYGKRFLIPRAQEAREILPEGLEAMGAHVNVVPVYKTVSPEDNDIESVRGMLQKAQIDAITFTSSSTVTHFVEMLGLDSNPELLGATVLASIGPITSKTLERWGLGAHVEAKEYTMDGLVQALCEYFQG
jgi:uroporphyrinogen III methyltransferase/synthase